MKIGILGTGGVGRTLADKLVALGHDVMVGTRDVSQTLSNLQPDVWGNPSFAAWYKEHGHVKMGTFADAAAHGEMVFNATSGSGALDAVAAAGSDNLTGKTLVDISNPLDFSRGFPPSLTVCNTDSLGERIQAAVPGVRVVKALNTLTAALMVNPSLLSAEHDLFICGNDAGAKAEVTAFLRDQFGWRTIHDVGDITAARATEMVLPIWLRLMGTLGTPIFNFHVAR